MMAASAVSCLPLIRKCTSISFYNVSPAPYFHSTPISSVWAELPFTGARLHRGGPSEGETGRWSGGRGKGHVSLLWLAKDPSSWRARFQPARTQTLQPGCRDCTSPCWVTVLTVQTTKTLLDIKNKHFLSLFLAIKKIAEIPTWLSTV